MFFPWGIPPLQSDRSLSCDHGLDYASKCENTNTNTNTTNTTNTYRKRYQKHLPPATRDGGSFSPLATGAPPRIRGGGISSMHPLTPALYLHRLAVAVLGTSHQMKRVLCSSGGGRAVPPLRLLRGLRRGLRRLRRLPIRCVHFFSCVFFSGWLVGWLVGLLVCGLVGWLIASLFILLGFFFGTSRWGR